MTTFLILFASHAAIMAFGYWIGWDNRGDVEWNRQHGITEDR